LRHEPKVYTLMVIPHSESPTFSLQFQLKWVRWAGLLTVLICCSLLLLTYNFMRSTEAASCYQDLLTSYQQQQQELLSLARQTTELQEEIAAVRELDAAVREMMNLAPAKAQISSVPFVAAQTQSAVGSRNGALSTTLARTEAVLQTVRDEIPASQSALADLKDDIAYAQAKALATPSIWPTSGHITSSYGYRMSPLGGGRQFHAGIDIGASRGTPIYATANGKVTVAGYRVGYGYMVQIDHGFGFVTIYGHMSKVAVKSGATVSRGDVIGYVGSSGYATGPHVHYEIRVNGRTVNPYPYLGG
jgi:murein DD-endopeptidase MepM/ murein hydrolase activator NlpD